MQAGEKERLKSTIYESTLSTAPRRFFIKSDVRKWYSSHGLPVITTIRVGPWRRAAPKAQDRVPRRGITLRSGMKKDVRRSVFLACHEDRSGGIFLADR